MIVNVYFNKTIEINKSQKYIKTVPSSTSEKLSKKNN